jgi:hypothetical protein
MTSLNDIQAAPAGFQPRLWPYVWKLLRLRWTIWISGFRRARTSRKIGMIC